ncbi:SdpI family protein [Lutimonas halocynthiae]|uniref:SdpI family protein n=1 Tax=Lutimonas halocynthiae TaxID=1446477 RepID=UPI0025B44FA1|nr:SdpI family protein [Lutimonas halocynthiae]MDN3641131.1 SdpI family protein [Lutimonas halocynthiae]
MKFNFQKEAPLIAIVFAPFIYLAYLWNKLPDTVPLHWNIEGEIDDYGDKSELILIPILLPLLIYIIFTIVPMIDPKGKINKMGNKYFTLKMAMTIFMSVLAMIIIYSVKNETLYNPNYIVLLMGVLFVILGNYFKTLRANYFIGIKTPWTLENETVWKETHKLAGKIWFIGGFIVILSSLLLNQKTNFSIFIAITIIISLVPVIYSFFKYKSLVKS